MQTLISPHLAPFAVIRADGSPVQSAWSWRSAAAHVDAFQRTTGQPHYVVRIYVGAGQ